VAQLGEVIHRLIEEYWLTVLLVEEKLRFARKYADRFAILDQGEEGCGRGIDGLTDQLI
jgi:urea transport system ATP-binding protein